MEPLRPGFLTAGVDSLAEVGSRHLPHFSPTTFMKKVSMLETDVSATEAEGKTSGTSESAAAVSRTTSSTAEAVSEATRLAPSHFREGAVTVTVWPREFQYKGKPTIFYSVSLEK